MVKLFKINTSSSSRTVWQCWGLPVNPTGHFPNVSDWWEVVMAEREREQQHMLWNKLPCLGKPNAKTDDHVLSDCYYQTHNEKNKTMWLILNDCLPDHSTGCQLYFFDSRVRHPAWAPVGSVLLDEALLSAGIFLYITYTGHCLLDTTLTEWSVLWSIARKRIDKTKHWQEYCSVVWCQCLRWVETPTHLTWFVWIH